mgnify:CR=1 FL=1
MERAVVLLSGGMDSSTLLHHVARRLRVPEVHALSFVYGQKHAREIEAARWQARAAGVTAHRVVELDFFAGLIGGGSALTAHGPDVPDLGAVPEAERDQPVTYVPHRNLILLALAAAYAEARQIADVFYGAQTQDRYGYWDCTRDFLERLNATLALNRRRAVTVHAPFLTLRKGETLALGLELGVDFSHTWSCYRGGPVPCRACPACVERAAAFAALRQADPLLDTKGQ